MAWESGNDGSNCATTFRRLAIAKLLRVDILNFLNHSTPNAGIST
jgi:hypothetical protein